jgi:hypothetical protein
MNEINLFYYFATIKTINNFLFLLDECIILIQSFKKKITNININLFKS